MSKFCLCCGAEISEDAKFCSSCGKEQNAPSTPTVDNPVEVPTPASVQNEPVFKAPVAEEIGASQTECKCTKNKNFIVTLVRNSFLLLVATVLCILSFLPIMKIDCEGIYDIDVEMSFSVFEFATLASDAAIDYDEEDLMDSALYEEIEEFTEDLWDDIEDDFDEDELEDIEELDDLPVKYQKAVKRLIFSYLRLGLQGESVELSAKYIFPVVSSILYITISVAFLAFAILNFLTSFNIFKKGQIFLKTAMIFLSMTPAAALFAYVVPFLCLGDKTSDMASALIAYLVIASVAVVMLIAFAFVFKQHERKFNIPLRAISTALSIVVICMCFAPIYTSSVKTEFNGKSKKSTAETSVYANFFGEFNLNEEQREKLDELYDMDEEEQEDYFNSEFKGFSHYTKREFTKGACDALNAQFLISIFAATNSVDTVESTANVTLAFILTALCAGIVLSLNLLCLMLGVACKKLAITAKILCFVSAAAALLLTILVLVGIAASLQVVPKGYSITIDAGAILLAAFAVLNVCFPLGKTKEIEVKEEQ